MNNAALAKTLEQAQPIELECSPPLRSYPARELSAVEAVPMPPRVVLPAPPTAAPRGFLQALWLRLFGPPAINPSAVSRDFGAFRAFSEIGSDYLPSSGTWPSAQGQTPITSGRS
jgi:hypothetical protein